MTPTPDGASGTDDPAPAPASPFAVPIAALEAQAHVPADDQVAEVPADRPTPGPWDGPFLAEQRAIFTVGPT